MPGKVIGKSLNHGFAGSYARTPDSIIATRPNTSDANIRFGAALEVDEEGGVKAAGADFAAGKFAGVAARETKSALSYIDQNVGEYAPDEAVSVFQRGSINVLCQGGTPALGGKAYVLTADAADTEVKAGDFTADSTVEGAVELTNAQWGGSKDANGVAELVLLTRINA